MAVRELKNFVNGEFVSATSGEFSEVINPATGEVYAQAPVSSASDVDAAFKAAEKAFETWGNTTPAERQLALFRIADAMEARAEEFADVESENCGKPRSTLVEYEIAVSVDQIRFFAGAARNLEGRSAGEYMADAGHRSFGLGNGKGFGDAAAFAFFRPGVVPLFDAE